MTTLTRRQALKLISKLSGSLYVAPLITAPVWTSASEVHSEDWSTVGESRLDQIGPIDRSLTTSSAPRTFFGDRPHSAHQILWNKESFLKEKGGIPKPTEERNIVVIGGGMSGLVSSYLLKDLNPLILEQAARCGGNSKGQSWRGIDYSIGAAYFCAPDKGALLERLLSELKLEGKWKRKGDEDPIVINNTIFKHFWKGKGLPPQAAKQAISMATFLKNLLAGSVEPYPDIPIRDTSSRKYIDDLDRKSLREFLEQRFGTLHPQIAVVVELFCWSSFGGSSLEIGAASGLNFLAAEFGDLGVLPGGNAAIAEALLSALDNHLPPHSIRVDSMVVDIAADTDGVTVTYADATGSLRSVRSRFAICASPKFVASRIVRDLEPSRVAAIKKLEYRAYLVANVLIQGAIDSEFYDMYLTGQGTELGHSVEKESNARWATDAICANYSSTVRNNTVLTLYRSLPYTGGRAQIYDDSSYDMIRTRFEKQIVAEVLPLLKVAPNRISDIRIARWGHPIPVARAGLIADRVTDEVRAPFRERVFFIEQDNWALPAIETCLGEAEIWTEEIRKRFGKA